MQQIVALQKVFTIFRLLVSGPVPALLLQLTHLLLLIYQPRFLTYATLKASLQFLYATSERVN